MERETRRKGDLLGVLAAGWIGSLGGLFVGALGQTALLVPEGYYVDGIIFGFLGGAAVGALAGLVAGMALVARFGNGLAAFLGAAVGWAGAAVYGLFAFGLASYWEATFRNNAPLAGGLAAVEFAAVGGVLAAFLRIGTARASTTSAKGGRRPVLLDLVTGGILGAFLGSYGGAYVEVATSLWANYLGLAPFWGNEGLILGFWLGTGVGAATAVLVGALLRRWERSRARARAAEASGPSTRTGVRVRLPVDTGMEGERGKSEHIDGKI